MTDVVLRVRRWEALGKAERDAFVDGRAELVFGDEPLREQIAGLVEDVRRHGDEAISRALREFDHADVPPSRIRVTEAELEAAVTETPAPVLAAIREAIGRSRAFNEACLRHHGSWELEVEPGVRVGELVRPIESAGLFVPSGKASYPSVLIHLGTPAVTAGVEQLAVALPPEPGTGGRMDPAALAVAVELGIRDVFRANGPAGVAALAFGTETVPRVGKVVGPGSPPVMLAELEVQRHGCATMLLLGPTECMVLADEHADPSLVAADLLCEAEHGVDSAAVLVTPSAALAEQVAGEVRRQGAALPDRRRVAAASALGVHGGAIVTEDLGQALDVANLFAPEHLQLAVASPDELLDGVRHAGEVLVGQHTPFAAANYSIGVPASLPTTRFARFGSGITAEAFTKTTSLAALSAAGLAGVSGAARALAEHEGFPAHGRSVSVDRVALDVAAGT